MDKFRFGSALSDQEDRTRMRRKSLLKPLRYLAVGSFILLIVFMVTANAGLIPEQRLEPVGAVVVLTFFLSVAAYAGSFVIAARQGEPSFSFYPVTSGDVPEEISEQYARAEQKVMAAGLAVWAGLICILAFGYLGSLIAGDAGGFVGVGLGVLITLAALAYLGRSWFSAAEARERAWRRIGRHRWEFLAYLAATVILAVLVATGNHLIRSTPGHGAALGFFTFVVVRLRMIWNRLW
jgi:hypothetical protein